MKIAKQPSVELYFWMTENIPLGLLCEVSKRQILFYTNSKVLQSLHLAQLFIFSSLVFFRSLHYSETLFYSGNDYLWPLTMTITLQPKMSSFCKTPISSVKLQCPARSMSEDLFSVSLVPTPISAAITHMEQKWHRKFLKGYQTVLQLLQNPLYVCRGVALIPANQLSSKGTSLKGGIEKEPYYFLKGSFPSGIIPGVILCHPKPWKEGKQYLPVCRQ